jgi:carbon-monoxide dehydrogenase large subunit
MDQALVLADWDGYPKRKKQSSRAGRIRGLGIACFMECVGGFPNEGADIRFTQDGRVLLVVATQSQGQSHETTFPQVVARRLGVPYELIELQQGNSRDKPLGFATVGSRSMIMAGSALANSCDIVIEKGRKAAAHILETSEADIEFRDGIFSVAGTDRTISLMEVARQISGLSQDKVEIPNAEIPTSLDSTGTYKAPDFHFPNGCHISEIEIDPETGTIEVLRYTAVDDVGTMINTHVVHGQVHGGIAQGLGQVLFENCVYDDEGQFLTGSFMDYAMPRAADF